MHGLVSVRVIRGSLAGMMAAGHDLDALATDLGLDPRQLREVDAYLPEHVWRHVWIEVERRSGDACAGIHAAEQIEWGHFDVVDYAIGTAGDLASALRLLARYFRILNSVTEFALAEAPDGLRVERWMTGDETLIMPRHAAEFSLACTVLRLRQASAREWVPAVVTLRHPPPTGRGEYRRLFGCEVRFGEPRDCFVVRRTDLATPMKAADPALAALVERHARDLLERLPRGRACVGDLRRVLARELAGGGPTIERAAEALGLSRRSLQRRLSEEGTTFSTILDQMRRELAQSYLRSPEMSIGEIGFLLGYSDVTAFQRAFKSWTGQSPGAYRVSPPNDRRMSS
jgi:AraC-like DNA-binding protein